jgi:hypothetical protein
VSHAQTLAGLTAARVIVEQALQYGFFEATKNPIQPGFNRKIAKWLRRALVWQRHMIALDHPAAAQRYGLKHCVF